MNDLVITLGVDKQTLKSLNAPTSYGCLAERTDVPVVRPVPEKLTCDACRAAYPSLLACAHTLAPHQPKNAWKRIPERNLDEERKETESALSGQYLTGGTQSVVMQP